MRCEHGLRGVGLRYVQHDLRQPDGRRSNGLRRPVARCRSVSTVQVSALKRKQHENVMSFHRKQHFC